jgi:hypothetical protein
MIVLQFAIGAVVKQEIIGKLSKTDQEQ